MAIITVQRGYGSGGDEVARLAAERLHLPLLDRQITSAVAVRAGVSEETLREATKSPSLLTRMAELLARYPMDDLLSWSMAGLPPVPPPTHEQYRKLIDEFIREVAAREDCVILGHGAQVVLKDHPRVLRVFLVAPFPYRVQRVMLEEGLDRKAAEQKVAQFDRDWRAFFQTQYGIDWVDTRHYDLIINLGRIGQEAAVDMIVRAAQAIDQFPR
ncbi:MAG: cytidylate kinase-like family protein [Chloroflexi bacterium]|nr:cytidylate kinase-like family protein [Chloroflexota bacterium]